MDKSMNPKQRNLIIGLIIIGLVIVGFFGLRTVRAFRQFHGRRPPPFGAERIETDVTLIRDWMTVPFISRMYHLPARILFDALGIPEHGNKEKSLKQLNEEFYPQTEGIILEKVKAAVLANQPQPTPTNPGTPVVPATPTILDAP
jgi:hypothetical protein